MVWTILLEEKAAANLFYLTEEPDAGDIVVQRPVDVKPTDYAQDLIDRTNDVLEEMVLELAPPSKRERCPARRRTTRKPRGMASVRLRTGASIGHFRRKKCVDSSARHRGLTPARLRMMAMSDGLCGERIVMIKTIIMVRLDRFSASMTGAACWCNAVVDCCG
ncbi:MAG: hypothetical protein R3E58_06910 [Phycisphaerae bacterium]